MAASLIGVPDLNTIMAIAMKRQKPLDNHFARIFLGIIFQMVMIARWNFCWIFCDIMLDTDYHRHSRRGKNSIRESSGVGLKSPLLLGTLDMSENNTVEVWVIGF